MTTYSQRDRFGDFMVWAKTLPCSVIVYPPGGSDDLCDGVIEADHAGARPMGRKCSDFEVVPLCKRHHDMRPGRRGPFAHLDRSGMRDYIDGVIVAIQALAIDRRAPNYRELCYFLGVPIPVGVFVDPDIGIPF